MGCIYNAKYKKSFTGVKHISTHVNLFIDHIYDKDTNRTGDTILEKIDNKVHTEDALTRPLGSY